MKHWFGLALLLAAAPFAAGQTSSGFGSILSPGSPSGSGFGNVLFPGGQSNVFSNPGASFADRMAATVIGSPGYTGSPAPGAGRPHRGRLVAVPVAVPVGFGYANPFYGPAPAPQQPITIVNQAPPGPQVVIHQTIVQQPERPADRVQTFRAPGRYDEPKPEPQAAESSDTPRIYLLAFTDGSVRSAVGYWVDGKTVHYLTPANQHNQVSLELIDQTTTKAINKDVAINLPRVP